MQFEMVKKKGLMETYWLTLVLKEKPSIETGDGFFKVRERHECVFVEGDLVKIKT